MTDMTPTSLVGCKSQVHRQINRKWHRFERGENLLQKGIYADEKPTFLKGDCHLMGYNFNKNVNFKVNLI